MLLSLGLTASLLSPTGLLISQDASEIHTPDRRPEGRAIRTLPQGQLPDINRAPLSVGPPVANAPRQQVVSTDPAPTRDAAPSELSRVELAALRDATTADRHSRLYFDEVNGTHWVRGRTYKASASSEGFSYIPFLGPNAPQNFPVHMRLTSIERSGNVLELDANADVRRVENRLILDRGVVEVRYDLDLEEVEQSFAFNAPGGAGDVTLHIEVTTELQGALEANRLRFSNDLGAVTYSEAIVLDGAGRVANVATRWEEGALQLTVPAAFVDSAQGPIVVDPIFGTEIVDSFMEDLRDPDLAYDAVEDRYLAVYEEQFSGADFDIYSQFVEPLPFATSDGTYIEVTGDRWIRPRVAQQRNTRRFLVVAEAESATIAGSTDIAARFRLADGALETPFVLKSATSSYDCETPDIGSEAGDFVSSFYCVVYSRDYGTDLDVHAIVVDTSGASVGSELTLANSVSRDEGPPAVSKSLSAGGSFDYTVAWPTEDLNNGEGKVEAALIPFGGGAASAIFDVTPFTSSTTYFDVEVSNQSERRHPITGSPYYIISYDDVISTITDAFLALCSAQTVHSIEELQVIEHHDKSLNENNVVIGTLEDDFILAYTSGSDLYVTIAQPIEDRLGMTERRVTNGNAEPNFGELKIATTVSGGSQSFEDGLVIWSGSDGNDDDIFAAFVNAPGIGDASGTQYCFGTPNSTGDHAYMIALGDRDRFNTQTLQASGLPANTFGFYLASTTQGLVPAAGGGQGTLCVLGSIGRFGTFNSGSTGRGEFSLDPQAIEQPNGTTSAFSGQTWNFQVWHRDAIGGVATSNFTNAVAIPFL